MCRSTPVGAKSAGDCAAGVTKSQLAALQALFMSRLEFEIVHPRMTRMLCGELKQVGSTPGKTIAQSVMRDLSERLAREFETAKGAGVVAYHADTVTAGTVLVGTIQGLVLQSLLSGNIEYMRAIAPEVLGILLRGVEVAPGEARSGGARTLESAPSDPPLSTEARL